MTRTLPILAVVAALGLSTPALAAQGAAPSTTPAKASIEKKPTAKKHAAMKKVHPRVAKKLHARKALKAGKAAPAK